jgi:hypothetical protein
MTACAAYPRAILVTVAVAGSPTLDLSDRVTVFVSTVGASTFDACLEHLRRQDCVFALRVVDHVAPMSAAFQRMLDECTTRYYVQVDEDMLLYPHAVRTLYERMAAMDDRVALYVAALYDVHLQRVIYGLKIFRHAIVRRYPLRDVQGCEWDQTRRFRADGYVDVRVDLRHATRTSVQTLGLHGTAWTPGAVYRRFLVLESTRRMGNKTHAWVYEAAVDLLKRFLDTRSEVDFYALMGVLAGTLGRHDILGTERDYRRYAETPGLDSLHRFVADTRRGGSDGRPLRPHEYDIDVSRLDGEDAQPPGIEHEALD